MHCHYHQNKEEGDSNSMLLIVLVIWTREEGRERGASSLL